jgi:hypothetical protein
MSFIPYDPSAGVTYANVLPKSIAHVEIYPPVGIARVGDSGTSLGLRDLTTEIEYYYGPEVPGRTDHRFGTFRDEHGKIKRQAVRFRVYAYDRDGKNIGEINSSLPGYGLTWKVHVANKKPANYLFRGKYRDYKKGVRNPDVDPVPAEDFPGEPLDTTLEKRTKLIIDPGEKQIKKKNRNDNDNPVVQLDGKFQGSRDSPRTVNLGELRTDSNGRLVVLPGSGDSASVQDGLRQPEIISEFDSVDWFDDVFDGWVDVTVDHHNLPGGKISATHKATVISGPPKFSFGIENPTSLYDIFEDMYKHKYLDHKGTQFYKDIWPVLSGTYNLSWVNNKALQGHGPRGLGEFLQQETDLATVPIPGAQDLHLLLRDGIFFRLRKPDFEDRDQANTVFMPRLSGDDGDALEPGDIPSVGTYPDPIKRYAALTPLQYSRFKSWRDGKFTNEPFPVKDKIEDYPTVDQPTILARAALEQTIGDPLYPGLEVFWVAKYPEVYDTENISPWMKPPFRINHNKVLPGFLGRGLSLPWQSDFDLCNTHWWPSGRPDDVIPEKALEIAEKFGNKDPRKLAEAISLAPRRPWARGLRETTVFTYLPGSTDMVKYWNRLGFVARVDVGPKDDGKGKESGDKDPKYLIFVEQERTLHEPSSFIRHGPVGITEAIQKLAVGITDSV